MFQELRKHLQALIGCCCVGLSGIAAEDRGVEAELGQVVEPVGRVGVAGAADGLARARRVAMPRCGRSASPTSPSAASTPSTCRTAAHSPPPTFARFVTRHAPSPWDFPEDALDAFRARLEREPEVEETLRQLAMDNDEPSVRASTVRLLASMSTKRSQDLTEELLTAECRRSGPPRFALDILTNRIRPAKVLMRDVLRTSNG